MNYCWIDGNMRISEVYYWYVNEYGNLWIVGMNHFLNPSYLAASWMETPGALCWRQKSTYFLYSNLKHYLRLISKQLMIQLHLCACSAFPVIIWYLIESLIYFYLWANEGPLLRAGNDSIVLYWCEWPIVAGTLE